MADISDKLTTIRHSIAHVMAEAVLQIFPDAKIAIGPAIENGFYYDFDLPRTLKPEDLAEIERRMGEIVRADHDFVRRVVSREEARELFKGQPFKLELIGELPEGEEISTYSQNGFTDLCRGPHVVSTRELRKAGFKLLSIAGAYWRGDETRGMLQRIYGTAWESVEELEKYLQWLEEVEKRDHRKLGKELDLFSIQEETGAGLIYWHPKGARLRYIIEEFWRKEHFRNNYELLFTPHIGRSWLWQTSGHLDFYNENMYAPMSIDNQDYYIKPMNCPFHIMIYKSRLRSYRDLPLRWAELGTVYRYERSGVLHGLLRVRGFTQDDAHIICTSEQIESEIAEVLRFSLYMWKSFGFEDIALYVATRPEKSVGDDSQWETAVTSLKNAIKSENMEYSIDEGGGAFYGPKIDFKIRDALGREWQVSTIQFDFNLPQRFEMTYIDHEGKERQPFMVHRALLGSLERFMGLLIENYSGAFPVWLSPRQVAIIPVTSVVNEFAEGVLQKLSSLDIRATVDLGDERMNAKIRDAQQEKIPYMLIIGKKEMEMNAVSLRTRTGEQRNMISLDEFISFIQEKIQNRELI
jgi:threonyl-tRNA synthetase